MNNSDLIDSNGKIVLKESERIRTEVWTRVMGYHRPVSEFNIGKQGEHAERVHFRLSTESTPVSSVSTSSIRFN